MLTLIRLPPIIQIQYIGKHSFSFQGHVAFQDGDRDYSIVRLLQHRLKENGKHNQYDIMFNNKKLANNLVDALSSLQTLSHIIV